MRDIRSDPVHDSGLQHNSDSCNGPGDVRHIEPPSAENCTDVGPCEEQKIIRQQHCRQTNDGFLGQETQEERNQNNQAPEKSDFSVVLLYEQKDTDTVKQG